MACSAVPPASPTLSQTSTLQIPDQQQPPVFRGTSLGQVPTEILLSILSHLDIPDLLAISRTSHQLRILTHDPLLHTYRLRCARDSLAVALPSRPSLTYLLHNHIYITRTTLAARQLGRNLTAIRLNRRLALRPDGKALVERGILRQGEVSGGIGGSIRIAPGLVERRREVEREKIKDGLREWVREFRRKVGERGGCAGVEEARRVDVRRLIRIFARAGIEERTGTHDMAGKKWRPFGDSRREEPARAKVLGLKRFWEGIGKLGEGTVRVAA